MRFVAPKGSICIDGVSLTVNEVEGRRFGVNIIPHTYQVTTLGELVPGSRVNVEIDVIARYRGAAFARLSLTFATPDITLKISCEIARSSQLAARPASQPDAFIARAAAGPVPPGNAGSGVIVPSP